jgi:hypothetical protein
LTQKNMTLMQCKDHLYSNVHYNGRHESIQSLSNVNQKQNLAWSSSVHCKDETRSGRSEFHQFVIHFNLVAIIEKKLGLFFYILPREESYALLSFHK